MAPGGGGLKGVGRGVVVGGWCPRAELAAAPCHGRPFAGDAERSIAKPHHNQAGWLRRAACANGAAAAAAARRLALTRRARGRPAAANSLPSQRAGGSPEMVARAPVDVMTVPGSCFRACWCGLCGGWEGGAAGRRGPACKVASAPGDQLEVDRLERVSWRERTPTTAGRPAPSRKASAQGDCGRRAWDGGPGGRGAAGGEREGGRARVSEAGMTWWLMCPARNVNRTAADLPAAYSAPVDPRLAWKLSIADVASIFIAIVQGAFCRVRRDDQERWGASARVLA